MKLIWNEYRVSKKVKVVAFARPKSSLLWALGHSQDLLRRRRSVLLRRRASGWEEAYAVSDRLDSIAVLQDGSVLAIGASLSVLFDGDRWYTIGSGVGGNARIWGQRASTANALVHGYLYYFDGRYWRVLDVGGGCWADGDCDSDGVGWVVGTFATHSCMMKGSGIHWLEDGCRSWGLEFIHVSDGGCAFTMGYDGVWRHDGAQWIDVPVLLQHRISFALSASGLTPIFVARHMNALLSPEARIGPARPSPGPTLEIHAGTDWKTVQTPIEVGFSGRPPLALMDGSRLLLARGPIIWEAEFSMAAEEKPSIDPRLPPVR